MEKLISYIIIHRFGQQDRDLALEFTLTHLQKLKGVGEVILVEQQHKSSGQSLATEPILKLVNKHLFLDNPGLFNRSKLLNIGVDAADHELVIPADSDIILEQGDIDSMLNFMETHDAVNPLGDEMENWKLEDGALTFLDIRKLYTFSGGAFIIKKSIYQELGGFDPRFEGWGGEDNAFSHILNLFADTHTFQSKTAKHIHHQTQGSKQASAGFEKNYQLSQLICSYNKAAAERYVEKRKTGQKLISELPRVLAVTTYNRIDYLKRLIDSFFETRDKNHVWHLLIADDGSDDGTLEYCENLNEAGLSVKVIKNNRQGVHHQTNTLIQWLENNLFSICFKVDDDIVFLKPGWDNAYAEAIEETIYEHLVYYGLEWRPDKNIEATTVYKLQNHWVPLDVLGCFYTLTPNVIKHVGYFDTPKFGLRGLGHIDYTLRACRAGFNCFESPFDIKNSNEFISTPQDDYRPSIPFELLDKLNSFEDQKRKLKIIKEEGRIFIPFAESDERLDSKKLMELQSQRLQELSTYVKILEEKNNHLGKLLTKHGISETEANDSRVYNFENRAEWYKQELEKVIKWSHEEISKTKEWYESQYQATPKWISKIFKKIRK